MNRLELIASFTKGFDSLVDVGCDHALASIFAILNNGVSHAYALDINDKPLLNAKKNIENYKLTDKIDVIKSDGLLDFDKEVDCLIIAGMGGILISDILLKSLEKTKKFKRLILCANSNVDQLRFTLINNHISIIDEYMIEDNQKIYEIIIAENKELTRKYNYFDMKFGPILRFKKDEVFTNYYERKLAYFKDKLNLVNDNVSKAKLKMEISMIEEVLHGQNN